MIKKVILDTDMGVDCDDCVALGLLLNKHVNKECEVLCVTASSARDGATATIKAICEYYNVEVEVGAMAQPKLPCDEINSYATAVKTKYNLIDSSVDAVKLIRETLANSNEKITFIAIGPLVNVRRFLESQGDEISPKTGIELAKDKIDALYIMGGSFIENYEILEMKRERLFPEWNILQDIESAQIVANTFPNDTYFVPWEAGFEVFTDINDGDNPVWFAMQEHARYQGCEINGYKRDSWDPVTCLLATQDCSKYFDFSKPGKVTISDKGITTYTECDGKTRITILKKSFKDIASVINAQIEPNR